MEDIKNFTLSDLTDVLKGYDLPRYCGRQIFNWIYGRGIEDFDAMTDIAKRVRAILRERFYFSRLSVRKRMHSSDSTEKFLFGLDDGLGVETVYIPEGERATLCVSTQAGCKFRCRFCLSGREGLSRNLKASEILNQYLEVAAMVRPRSITNIVFMGIGEPLDNFSPVVKSICILKDPGGIHFGKGRICLSTCGIIPKIEELITLRLGIKLSISLHAADDKKRSQLMPVNRKYPLNELMKTARDFSQHSQYPVTFEYLLIRDFNTSSDDALKLARLLGSSRYKINLIPYNPSSHFVWKSPQQEEVEAFTRVLKKRGVFFTLRKPRGADIHAACGQLHTQLVQK